MNKKSISGNICNIKMLYRNKIDIIIIIQAIFEFLETPTAKMYTSDRMGLLSIIAALAHVGPNAATPLRRGLATRSALVLVRGMWSEPYSQGPWPVMVPGSFSVLIYHCFFTSHHLSILSHPPVVRLSRKKRVEGTVEMNMAV